MGIPKGFESVRSLDATWKFFTWTDSLFRLTTACNSHDLLHNLI